MISPHQNQIMNKSPIGQNDTEIMPIRNFNGPQDFIFPIDPFQELAESKSVIISQRISCIDYCCNPSNSRWDIMAKSESGMKYLFKCKEKRRCCCVRCCKYNFICPCCYCICSDPLFLYFYQLSNNQELEGESQKLFITAKRPDRTCTCKTLRVETSLEPNKESIGTAALSVDKDDYCCTICFDIIDSLGNVKYKVTGDLCQAALLFGYLGRKLCTLSFNIKKEKEIVGKIEKLSSSWSEYFADAVSYKVNFPKEATPHEKFLFIISVMLFEYSFQKPR